MANTEPQGIEAYGEGEVNKQEEVVNQNQPEDKAPLIQPPPAYTQPRLAPETHPQPFGNVQAQQTTVVVSQPQSVLYRQEAPEWIGSQWLIIASIFTLLCCGLLPGLIALAISWEARNKREMGLIEEARSYSIASIVCNVVSMLLGVGAIVGAGVYAGIYVNAIYKNYS